MANKQTTQTTQPQQMAFDTLAQLTRDNIARINGWVDELAEIEAASYDYVKDVIGYGPKLAAEWRRLMLESTKKTADLWTAKV